MPATLTDRLFGLTTSTAVKPPCQAVATTPIALLGLPSINGYQTQSGDRVLVAGNTNPIENGIYLMPSSSPLAWTRAPDFDGADDVVNGTLVVVNLVNGFGAFYQVVGTNPIYPGTSPINFILGDNPNITYPSVNPEVTANVTIINHAYVAGVVDRYGSNTIPGTTDMSSATQAAVNVALAALSAGRSGVPVQFGPGAYLIVTPPTFLTPSTNGMPIDIGGAPGWGTQIINAAAANKPTFDFTGCSSWRLHDLLLTGNSSHPNNGVTVNRIGGGGGISTNWIIERVWTLMPGVGFYLAETNSAVMRDCRSWSNGDALCQIAPVVTGSDRGHHVYLTGGFVHQVGFEDLLVLPNFGSNPAQRGIKNDCSDSLGCSLTNINVESGSGQNNEVGIDWNCSGFSNVTMEAIYHEGSTISLGGVINSKIAGLTDGGLGGSLVLNPGTRENLFSGVSVAILNIADPSAYGNTFIGASVTGADAWSSAVAYQAGRQVTSGGVTYNCILANTNQVPPNATYWAVSTSFVDSADVVNQSNQPNRFIGCSILGFGAIPDRGRIWRKLLTYAHAMAPDTYGAHHYVIRVSDNFNFNIAAPVNPSNGFEMKFTVRNEVGGAMGSAPTFAGAPIPGWTSPASTKNRTFSIYYDSDFGGWYVERCGAADVPN